MNKRILLLVWLVLLPLLSFAQTANWNAVLPALFPTNMSGQIHGLSRCSQIKFHPSNANKIYAISARGGLFISTNGGNNWNVAPGTDYMASMRLASVCVDHTNDSILYLGTGDHNYYYSGSGVYKSINGGQTFTSSGLSGLLVCDMLMDPLDPKVIVAITNSGIYKTTNGGTSWNIKTAARPFDDIKQKAINSRTLYATTNDSAFFRSTDFGNTWSQITSGIVLPSGVTNGNGCRVAVTPADTNVVYLGMVANGGLLYKSTDGGSTFSAMKTASSPYLTYYSNASTSSGQGDYNFSIGVDRTNASIVYLVAHNIWKSTNSGVAWTQMTNWWEKCHTDMHQIITSPYNNNNLYDVNDGGIFLSTDGGTTWNPKSDGLYGYEIYHGSCSPTRKDMFSIGTQDNGELYATSTGWYTNRGGDWQSHCVFDYRANSAMVYYYNPDWGGTPVPKRRLVTGSENTYGLPAAIADITDIAFNRSDVNLAFVADSVILRTNSLTLPTPTWTQIASLGKKIMAIHSSIADANRLYAITSDGMIYVSNNALASTPTFTSYSLPNSTNNAATITTIKSNSNVVYITANTQVYRSGDNGATWTSIKYNLPSVNHVRILSDEYFSANEMVFIASGSAVYYKTANAQSWSIYSDLLPTRTSIVEMYIFNDSTSNTMLRVATYGRGMWETPINNLRSLAANFAVDNVNPCLGQTITFSDLSTGTSTSRLWSFPGGTPSTSTAVNPTVTYNSAGSFNVTLKVFNGTTDSSTISRTAYITTTGGALPLAEGFEGTDDPPLGWKNVDYLSNGYLWQKTNTTGGFANSASSMYFDNYNWNVPGQKDQLITKRLSFAGYNSATLTFDVAYMPYTGYSDTLRVLVSTDCGATYTPVYSKGGSVLGTVTSGTSYFTPTAAQWRKDTVSLNSYIGNNSVLVAFENINGYGNALYLDNVNINATVAANAGNDASICSGNSVNIGMQAISGINYSWSPSTGLSNANVSNPTATPTTTTSYVLTATHALSGITKTDTLVITVTPLPTLNAGSDVSVCSGNAVTLNASSNTTVTWNNGITNNIAFTPISTTSYVATANNNGCINKDTVIVTVNPMPTINAGIDVSVCTGNSVVLNASSATSFVWNNGISNNQSFTPIATSNYIATATNNLGCSKSDTVLVTVNPLPTINAGDDVAVCNGGNIILNAISNGTVTWNIGIINNQPFTPVITTNYVATATSSFGCVNTDTVLVSLFALSVANPGTDKAICPGGSTTLTATGGGTYWWSNGDTTASTLVSQAGTYYVVVTNNNGCRDTSSLVTVSMKTMPTTIKIKSTAVSTTVCEPNNVPFVIDLAYGSTTGFDYQWKLNGSPIIGATDSTWNAVQTGSYSLTISGGANCIKTSAPKTATIKPLPIASFTIGGPTTICSGGSVSLTAPTITGYTYTWLKDGLSAGSGNIKVFKLAGVYTVIAKLAGCNDTASNPVTIVVNALPTASVIATTSSTFCAGDSCTISASPAAIGFSYEWHNGNTIVATTTTSDYNALITGTFKVMITDTNSCVSKLSTTSVKTKQNPIPTPTISVTGSTTIAANGSTKLNVMPSSGVTWQWYKDGNMIIGATTKQLIVTSGGNYSVAITKLGCIGYSSPITITQTPAKEIQGTVSTDNLFEFSAFPNPVSEILTLQVRGLEDVNATVYMLDINGQTVGSWLWRSDKNSLKIDMSKLSSGIYLIRYKDAVGRTGTAKVVKE